MFAVELKWVVETLQPGVCMAFTQFLSRLVTHPPGLIARAISAMSILYQQWSMCVGLVPIVSAQGAKTSPFHLISNGSRSMLILVSLCIESRLSEPQACYLMCDL